MEKLKIALLGCGRIAQRHAIHISRFANLVAVCDILPERADALAEEYGAKAMYSVAEMLEDKDALPDVIAICTPNGLHAKHAIAALKAGCHVLVEKPMALTSADCGDMIQTAERMNRRLFVIKQNRYNPPVAAVKDALDAGRLGKICSVQLTCFWNRDAEYYTDSEWKGTKQFDGGTLYTQFSHFIDLLYWYFGDVKEVHASMKNFLHQGVMEFEDAGVVMLNFNSGVLGTINYSVCSTHRNMEGSLTIIGEKGTVKIGGQYLNTLEYQEIQGEPILMNEMSNPPNEYGKYTGSMSNHDKVYENLVAVLQEGKGITTNFFEGLKTVEIIERIYAAANIR